MQWCLKKNTNQAFTLVELSVVLVILSILVSAIIGITRFRNIGVAQSIATEAFQLKQSVAAFYATYQYLPGDYPYAWNAFSKTSLQNTPLLNISQSEISSQFISGDGNGKISHTIQVVTVKPAQDTNSQTIEKKVYQSESYGVWAHLSASGYLNYPYSNFCSTIDNPLNCSKPGFNLPGSKRYNGSMIGYMIHNPTSTTTHGALLNSSNPSNIINKNVIEMIDFTEQETANGRGKFGGTTPEIAQTIDTKFDDSNPFTGEIFSLNGENQQCHTATDNQTYTNNIYYNKDSISTSCILIYAMREF
jgi:prepilin-type N-terminal cleavage/methylation domain-containing protein